MHFFKTLLAGAFVLALAAAEKPTITSIFQSLTPGQTVTITWTGGDSKPVDLILRSGNEENLNVDGPIGTGTGNSYSWTVPSDLKPNTKYSIEIVQDGQNNYSPPFSISGATGTATAILTGSATASLTPDNSTITTTSTSTSTPTSSITGNLTSTVSLKTTGSSAKATPTGTSPAAPNANANTAAGLASPLALVLSAVMAMIYFN
ncbi:MAG: hypothetical protein M1840_003920 [Geoglossum simile]|nr:MAG: hypothetical protein M1840_003920 [Geoglossum simile]